MGYKTSDSGQGHSVCASGISPDVFAQILEQHELGKKMDKFVGNSALAPRFAFRDCCILVKDEIRPWDIREWEENPRPLNWIMSEEQLKIFKLYNKLREFQGGRDTPKKMTARVMMKDGCLLIKDERLHLGHRPRRKP